VSSGGIREWYDGRGDNTAGHRPNRFDRALDYHTNVQRSKGPPAFRNMIVDVECEQLSAAVAHAMNVGAGGSDKGWVGGEGVLDGLAARLTTWCTYRHRSRNPALRSKGRGGGQGGREGGRARGGLGSLCVGRWAFVGRVRGQFSGLREEPLFCLARDGFPNGAEPQ